MPADCGGSPCYTAPVLDGVIDGAAPEASGLAPSSTDPDLFFTVDDGTGVSQIVAFRVDGTVVGQIAVDGMTAGNAEALAPGVCEAGSADRCLYVGDIGEARSSVTVYRVAEPDPTALPSTLASTAWKYRYPDGTFNAEAMLIDDDGGVIIVTKPDGGVEPHRVYLGAPGGGELTLATTFTPPAPERPLQSSLTGNVVTDASRLPDRVLLLFYDQAVEYLAPTPGAGPATFPSWPYRQLAIPSEWQSEGIAYRSAAGATGCGYVVVSEKSPLDGPAIGSVGCS